MADQLTDAFLSTPSFYDKISSYYDEFMEEGESTLKDEIALVISTFPSPCRILDVGCGTGRIAISLQQAGYMVVGLDISSKMIKISKEKGLVRTTLGDVHSDELDGLLFDGIISLHTGFSYTNDKKAMLTILERIYDLLKENGIVLWDTPNEDYYGKKRVLEWEVGGMILRTRCYGHNKDEVTRLFEQSGFEVVQIWGKYTPLKFFSKGSPRIIIHAKKLL